MVQSGLAETAFGVAQPGLHITLEVVDDQGGYRPGDEPVYAADSGPTCRGLPPNAPERPFPASMEVTDGYCDDQEQRPGIQSGCEGRGTSPAGGADPVGLLTARSAVAVVAGAVLGMAPDEVPDLALLLLGPMARGTEVGLSPTGR